MQFGICVPTARAGDVAAAGGDFTEENVQNFLQGQLADSAWQGAQLAKQSPLPLPAANSLVPADLKITGPAADLAALRKYMSTVIRRAKSAGMTTLVFGSAGARNVPKDFSPERAREQIIEFLEMSATIAEGHGIMLVIEPLNRGESNIINSVGEAMSYVRAIGHPHVQCLVDSYHFWLEDDSLADLQAAMPNIYHVHVADKDGRVASGESGKSDYRVFFRVLKDAQYPGIVSVETPTPPTSVEALKRMFDFLRKQWQAA